MNFIDELLKEKASIEKRLKAINELLDAYGIFQPNKQEDQPIISTHKPSVPFQKKKSIYNDPNAEDHYDPNWTLVRKFVFLLKENDRFLHFREAAEMIVYREGLREDPKKIAGKLTAVTVPLKKENKIVKFKADSQNINTFWGIPEWLNPDGSIRPGHEFNQEYLSNRKEPTDDLFKDF